MRKFSLIIPIVILLVAGCGGAKNSSEVTAVPTAAITPAVTSTATVAPTLTPVPSLPAGWSESSFSDPALGFFLPPNWYAEKRDNWTVDLRQENGAGWAEISLISAESAHLYGLDPAQGLSAAAISAQLLAGLNEEGVFSEPEAIWPYFAETVIITSGVENVYGESLFVGVAGRADSALLLIGHQGDGGWEQLTGLYHVIAASLG